MIDAIAHALLVLVGAVLCGGVIWGWWWESSGRREWERELRSREDADHRERMRTRKGGGS